MNSVLTTPPFKLALKLPFKIMLVHRKEFSSYEECHVYKQSEFGDIPAMEILDQEAVASFDGTVIDIPLICEEGAA